MLQIVQYATNCKILNIKYVFGVTKAAVDRNNARHSKNLFKLNTHYFYSGIRILVLLQRLLFLCTLNLFIYIHNSALTPTQYSVQINIKNPNHMNIIY